ncbi:MAG: OsmC family peroxiredoxin [Candidatus Makaraimicrobium thalassicum]|nr:MAG: OsmC family peroxiredoxin [Candidatus Omnitrophota bacterium]
MGDIKKKSKKFTYKTTVTWKEEKKGFLCSFGKETIKVATPPEFKGHEGMWTPEDLFVASVNVCIKTTFLYYAQKNNLEFLSYESEAEGVLEKVEDQFRFSKIKVIPKIVVRSSTQLQKAEELVALAEKNCLISNSIKSEVNVIPEVSVGT